MLLPITFLKEEENNALLKKKAVSFLLALNHISVQIQEELPGMNPPTSAKTNSGDLALKYCRVGAVISTLTGSLHLQLT